VRFRQRAAPLGVGEAGVTQSRGPHPAARRERRRGRRRRRRVANSWRSARGAPALGHRPRRRARWPANRRAAPCRSPQRTRWPVSSN